MSNETISSADVPADEQTPFEQENSEQENSEQESFEQESSEQDSDVDPHAGSDAASLDDAPAEGEKTVAPLAAVPPPLSPVERMEVRIDFEVGRVTLPVSSLANVAAGSVIEVPGVALDRVTAKSGGHAFAFGEFVELGGRVGFRILKLAETKEKP